MLGPGAYNTLEEERIRKKYAAKHEELSGINRQRGLIKVGKNLIKANTRVPEYEETQKKLQNQ